MSVPVIPILTCFLYQVINCSKLPGQWMLLMLLYLPLLPAQNTPHPSFRHFTTDDGLPSPEVYCLLQDREGYIWISTDNLV